MKDGRGAHMVELKLKNRTRVKEWMLFNPNGTKTQAMKDLDMSFNALNSHIKAIQKGNDNEL